MWSDELRPARQSALQARIRRLLPSAGRGLGERVLLDVRAIAPALAGRLRRRGHFVWLDDSASDRHLMAFAPPLLVRAHGGRAQVRSGVGSVRARVGAFDLLQAVMRVAREAASGARLFGHLGYELAGELEQLPAFPPADMPVPDMLFGLHDLWLEGEGDRWWLCGPGNLRPPEAIAALRSDLAGLEAAVDDQPCTASGDVSSEPSPAGYRAAVERTVARIHAGEIFETNLCRRLQAPLPLRSAWTLYLRMRETGAAAHGAYVQLPRAAILSRSPECFLRVRSRHVTSLPIKGTRPRDADPCRDAALLDALRTDPKDAAELAMIVDLVRNDLGRVCRPGSVQVVEHAAVMQLATVWHTCSRICGELRGKVDEVALLRAAFPPGSITGAPKIQAITVAMEEEPRRRGVAMGSIGWIGVDGDLELSVAIRTAVVGAGRVVYHAGCGIVADSDPQAELAETEAKARVFLEALAGKGNVRS